MPSKEFSITDLIHDPSFRRLVKGTANTDEVSRWDAWIEETEQNRIKAKQAMVEIAGFEFAVSHQPDIELEWEKLQTSISKKKIGKVSGRHSQRASVQWIYRVAALLAVGIMAGLGLYFSLSKSSQSTHVKEITDKKTISTQAGEQKHISFSNGSRIILNDNSSLTYRLSDREHTIKVSLTGEAFFDAVDVGGQKDPVFAVHTPDGIISDIGTKFLVTVEGSRSRVILEEGRVQINTGKEKTELKDVELSAGEMLEFDSSRILAREKVNSTFYTSWATGSMKFDNTSVRKFAGFVEDRFDVNVKIVDPSLAGIKIDGGIYFRSLEELVRSVSEVADLPVYQSINRDTVYIGKPTQINTH